MRVTCMQHDACFMQHVIDNNIVVKFVVVVMSVCLSVCVFVCLSVCARATGHTVWPRNLIFGLSDSWDMRKKQIFLFSKIYIFTLFIGIFRFFPYIYNTSKFLLASYRSQFFT